MILARHLEGCLGSLDPAPVTPHTSFQLRDPQVLHREVGVRLFRDDADGVALIRRPASEIQDYGRSADEHLISDPDHAALEDVAPADESWRTHAREWFACFVGDSSTAHFPVIDVGGEIVATAIGTLELGVPNPKCPRGRTVRLANVITLPEHRAQGYATLLVHDVVAWANSIDTDRVDLSATPEGQSIYDRAGFVLTSAPRMKLVL